VGTGYFEELRRGVLRLEDPWLVDFGLRDPDAVASPFESMSELSPCGPAVFEKLLVDRAAF
jgi:hypothetical protein